MNPASTMIVKMYGIISMNCTGMFSPDGSVIAPCIWIVSASINPKNRHASSTGTGFHLPRISAASHKGLRPCTTRRPIHRKAKMPAAAKEKKKSTPDDIVITRPGPRIVDGLDVVSVSGTGTLLRFTKRLTRTGA